MRRVLAVLVVVAAIGVAGYVGAKTYVAHRMTEFAASHFLIGGGGGCSSGDSSISGVNFRIVPFEPIVLYATWSAPGRPRSFSYVILMPPPREEWFPENGSRSFSSTSQIGLVAEATAKIDVGALHTDVRHRFDVAQGKATGETLEMFGKPVDLAAGRLFLYDPSSQGKSPAYRQLALPLGAPAEESASATEAVEATAKRLVADLEKDETIRAFLGR
jgi:hypothetical protein